MTKIRIDELARRAGTTVRNVRSYQEKGLLPPPTREGRVAYYGETHLARLRVVGTLLERGFSLVNIAELIETWQEGKALEDVLGLEEALTHPFSDDEPIELSLVELGERYRTSDTALLQKAIEVGLVETGEFGTFRVPRPRLLKAGVDLHGAGIPVGALFAELARVRADAERIAERFVDVVQREIVAPRIADDPELTRVPELSELVQKLRPIAKTIVDAEFSRALERAVRIALGERMTELFAGAAKRPKKGVRAG